MKNYFIFLILFSTVGNVKAQFTSLATDPQNDAGNGIDSKSLSYQLSQDKKNLIFRFETYSDISQLTNGGFLFFIDEDLNLNNGMTPFFNTNVMKADKLIECLEEQGTGWVSRVVFQDTTKNENITQQFKISFPDNNTALITLPLNKIDKDGDGKFNLMAGAVLVTSVAWVDGLPENDYIKMNVLAATGMPATSKSDNDILIYPNPAKEVINLSSNAKMNGQFKMYNMAGIEVLSKDVAGNKIVVNTSHLAPGVYVYEITDINNLTTITRGRISLER